MGAQHTPGPWIVTHVLTSAGSAFRIGQPGLDKGCAWIYADGIRIGIDDKLPRAIELAAKARLIAAAPDLLAFAEAYRLDLQARGIGESDMDACAMELLCMADAAIEKATGAAS
jgi:hypothetical protein